MSRTRRMRVAFLITLTLLLLLLLQSVVVHVDALRVVSARLSNATAAAPTNLSVTLDFEGARVAADAVFLLVLHPQLLLADAVVVDTALLTTQLDGELQVSIADANAAIVIARGADATDTTLAGTTLTLQLTQLTAPRVAGAVSLGSLSVGTALDASAYGAAALPSFWIAPGRVWNGHIAFVNLFSGRETALQLTFTPSHAVLANGSVLVHLPRLYAASSASLQALRIAGTTNIDGQLQLDVIDTALRFSWATDASSVSVGGLVAMRTVVLQLDGLRHPLLEGPIGRVVRIETTDADNGVIDQALVDISALLLERATVQLTKRSLHLQSAGSGEDRYAISLSAPPQSPAGMTILISLHVSDSSMAVASRPVVEPSFILFTLSNWTLTANVTVRALEDDDAALPSTSDFILSHTIIDADATETSFAPIDDVVIVVEASAALPLVRLSSRYVAVAERLRNDSYTITLLARPSSDVTVAIDIDASAAPLLNVVPSLVTFTSSSWAVSQTVRVEATSNTTGSPPTSSAALRTRLTHHIISSDLSFTTIVPQSSLAVYYEPLAMVACVEPCRAGWFPAFNSSNSLAQCIACPLGSYCPGECAQPTSCPAGTHSTTAFAATSNVCVDCPTGSYANAAGSSRCSPCPAGAACPHRDASFESCPAGTFALESQGSCRPCPAGTYSNATFRERCDSCPVGSYCAGGVVLPTACANGTYAVENGAKPCASCPAGYACSTSSATPMICPDGSYSLVGDLQCRVCPQGYYCPNSALAPIACRQGTYSQAGAKTCALCPFGHFCTLPDLPRACAVGETSNANYSACVACPAGFACPIAAATPVQCASGSFSTGGAIVCAPCAAGYACPDTTSIQRFPCVNGTYSMGGAALCTGCPAGYACPSNSNGTVSTPCASGWYSLEGSAACLECPSGSFCAVPSELPKNCSVGSYSLPASTSCVPCAPGYECPRADQLPQPCPVGYYSGGSVANCRACRPGYKCGLAATNPTPPEDACPMGGYCNPPTTFFLCPAGTYGNVTAGESVDQACAPCPEGFYCEMGSTPLTTQSCPPGYVCPVGTKRASQFPCRAGTFNPRSSQFSLDVCQVCPKGAFCVQGSANPVVCPQGYYCPEGTLSSNQYPCPAGSYSGPRTGLTIASECKPCELSSFCPEASSTPTLCPAGTYNPKTGAAGVHECLDCPPGWSCPRVGQFEYVDRCATGHYCPSATAVAMARPCPAGTYTDRVDLIRLEDCTVCPLRHACPEGTGGDTQTMLACGAGFFCPNGTAYATQFPCPPGSWSTSMSLADASECEICPVGKYCSGGKAFIDGPCSPGYYCPLGTPSPTKFLCPSGTFTSQTSLFEPSQCDDCPPGSYCPAGSIAPLPCKPGTFSSFNNTKSVGPGVAWPACVTCPAGYYCSDATVVPAPCGKGRFSPKGAKSCALCEAGYFCNSNTTSDTSMRTDVASWRTPGALFGACYNGTYCPLGSDHEPALEIDACPRGYFCPKATPAPLVCPAGTYSNLTGQDDLSDCIPTPAGFYSLEGSLQPTGPCDPGFYCPLRSTARTQIPCPARYYVNRTGGQSEDDCAVCVAGGYCPRGTAYPITCPTGAYCRTGVSSPEPCPIGTYSNALGIGDVDDCLVCPPGKYCDATGLTVPRGPCDPGYYCTLGSYTSAPMSFGEMTLFGVATRDVGGQCPRGSYCPLSSASPTPCPAGTSNNVTGLETERQCVPCPPGKYCETPGLVVPTGDCFSGYFCTGGASTPTQNATPAGSFTGNGSTAPVPCRAGQFNSYGMQEQCVECPAGFFCGSLGTIRPVTCPTGNYCPMSTALPIKCPPGTYSAMEGLVAVLQCQRCPAGYFCDSFGLAKPSGPCLEGFVCFGGSPFSNPVAVDYGDVCPAGYYCPVGSSAATQCPRGSFRATTGGTSLASCSVCPGGSYCGANALTAPSGLCNPGYFCTQNASSATPSGSTVDVSDGSGGPCPTGSFCLQGSSQPQLCPEGTYADALRVVACAPCPAGYVCPLGSADYASRPCPQGYYCPVGTKRDLQFPCLPGTYGNRTGLQDPTQCTPAPGGMYVDVPAAVKPTGLCKSGFYCVGGSSTNTPSSASSTGGPCLPGTNCPEGSAVPIVCAAGFYCSSSNTDRALPCDAGFYCVQGSYTATPTGQNNSLGMIGDVCLRGHYCPVGTSNPIPCLPGTFSQNPQNENATQCFPCPPGFVCSDSGIVTPVEKCPAGFLCTGGVREASQQCPKGFECPLGSATASPCPAGTFSDVDGLAQCKLCPARYYCVAGMITPVPCPVGFFCPLQTPTAIKFPCLPGSYSNATLLASAAECTACPPGQFCSGAAPTNRPTGDCAPGHFCVGGAKTATPTDGTTGDLCGGGFVCVGGAWLSDPIDTTTGSACPPGFYCPRGSSAPVRCAKGSYNAFEKQSVCLACPAGGYCDTNATAPVPCPLRSYCPQASAEPVLCPSGTYGHAPSLASADQCAPCTAGKFCVGGTLTASCAAGYYCKLYNAAPNPPLNTTTDVDFGGPCPVGHYCPEGVVVPLPCPNATARLTSLATQLDDCGPCPAGKNCANGARTVPCPAGFYCAYAQSAVACPPGTYNPLEGQVKLSDCQPCRAGKLCNSSAIIELTEIYDCPMGHYCLEASAAPTPCPQGRFRRTRGAMRVDDCAVCPGGSFCGVATIEPQVCVNQTYCPTGSGASLPCPGGAYCSSNSSIPIQCPMGFYCAMQVALPTACDRGFYCPMGSVAPLACPLGFIGRETPLQGVRSRLQDACEPCLAGTFGVDPNRTRCDACLEGYVCLEATRSSHPQSKDHDNGYPCPPGFYCPIGSSKELPCPSGTYQPTQLATNATDCRPCPVNSYQNIPGQASCLPCSKSAYASGGGAAVCTCKGSHRAFQMTDGYCICEPGFEFYDQDMVLRSDEDDDVDCQPIVYDRCGTNQVRADGGACVAASATSCESSCGNSTTNTTGTLVASLGVCQCDRQVDVDTVCDKPCREAALRVRVDAATGELRLYDPLTGKTESVSSLGIVSKVSCAGDASACQLRTVALTSGGFAGSYDVPTSLGDSSSVRRRRRLAASATAPSTIANPMVCLHVGEGIFFDLSTPDAYPIYLKDSMLNTNPTFDYGAFRALASKVKANTSTVAVSAFAFSFTEPGIYVFGNSLNGAAKTVITVMQAGTACPTEAPILPLNEKNLIAVSVKRRTDDMILAPDWGLIIGLLGGLVGMVVAVIAGLYYFRTKSWATSSTRRRLLGYRATSKATDLATMHSKGVAVAANKAPVGQESQQVTLTPAPVMVLDDGKTSGLGGSLSPRWPKGHGVGGFEPDLARWEEEDLDLRELVERLQQHHDSVTKCFDDQKGDVKSLLEHLQNEATELKRLIVQALASAVGVSQQQTPAAAAPVLAAHVMAPVVTPRAARSPITASVPLVAPDSAELRTTTSPVPPLPLPPASVPITVLSPLQTTLSGTVRPFFQVKSESATLAIGTISAAVSGVPTDDEPNDLRQTTDATRHKQIRHEYVAMLQKTSPQLSSDDRSRLVDEFANDLSRLESSLSVEAHKAHEDVKALRTARAVMADHHERVLRDASEQQTQVLEQNQQLQRTMLESKFAQEEDAIEQEYQRELQRLEQEFDALDGGEGDEAFPMSEREDDEAALAFDEMDEEEEGDAATPEGFEENDEGDDAQNEQALVETEYKRLLEEHDRERQALITAQDAERKLRQQHLRDALAQLSQQKLGAMSSHELDAEDELAMIALRDELDAQAERAARDQQERHAQAEAAARKAVGEATGKIAASEVARRAMEAARELELGRLALEVEQALGGAVEDDDAKNEKAVPIRMKPTGLDGRQDPKVTVAQVMEDAVEKELARVKREFADSLHCRIDQIDADVATRKALLGERVDLKRKALAIKATNAEGPTRDEIVLENAAVDEEERTAEALIQQEAAFEKRTAAATVHRDEKQIERGLQQAARASGNDLEQLLDACRRDHERNAEALQRSLEQERQRRDAMLQERLTRKRGRRMAELSEQHGSAPATELAALQHHLEIELAERGRRERVSLHQQLTDEDTRRLAEAERQQQQHATELMTQAAIRVNDRHERARQALTVAEEEMRRVQDDHAREMAALQASLATERKCQELKLLEKLAARRAARQSQGMTTQEEEEAASVEEALECVMLREQLERQAAKAIAEMRHTHDPQKRHVVHELVQASADAVTTEAARQAIEAARPFGSERITDALPSHHVKKEASSDPVDSRTVAKVAMEDAVDGELKRIKQQYADSLGHRIDQIELEFAGKKVALRDRIEQKRRALGMRAAAAGDKEPSAKKEQQLQEEQAAAEAAIDKERAMKQCAVTEESECQQRAANEAFQLATNTSNDELKRLLEACQRSHAADTDALQLTLDQERKLKEQQLRDRLARRCEQALADAMKQQAGAWVDQAAMRASVEKEMLEEEEMEQTQLAQCLENEDARRLQEATAAHRRQAIEMIETMETKANALGGNARAAQAAAEDELRRVQNEHARDRAALEATLSAERQRREQKLQDKLAARRAQRKATHPDHQEDQAMAAEDELERLQLQQELQDQAATALDDERRRHGAQEQAIANKIAIAAAEARAADAGRRAIDAARQAEIDRIGMEFEASRTRAMDGATADAASHRSRLNERLAQKQQRRRPTNTDEETPNSTRKRSIILATKKVLAMQRSLRSLTKTQTEKEMERLRGEHAVACEERFAALDQAAAVRKARLAERIAARRKGAKAAAAPTQALETEHELEVELAEESRAIDEDLAAEKQKIVDEMATTEAHVQAELQAAAKRTADEMDKLLQSCQQNHDEETEKLQRTLAIERQRQEKNLQDRIAKRKQQRQKTQLQAQLPAETVDGETVEAVVEDAEADERERRELEAQLRAKEALVWEDMRRQQEAELLALTKQAEAAALAKQLEAQRVQESAQLELERLKRDHEAEMTTLTASLVNEQKRQQQQLQQRIAARRSKQQKQHKDTEDTTEKERLAKLLEEQETAELERQMEAELARRLDEERERQRQQEAELIARVAHAEIDGKAAEAARQAMDAARTIELERLANEFDATSRELRQTHLNDLHTQKQKLEARVAAKKQKKMMELEAKRAFELQKLKERQEQEARDAETDKQRAEEAVDDALMMAAAGGEGEEGGGDASAPPLLEETASVAGPTAPPEATVISPKYETIEEEEETNDETAHANQQARDVAAIQQLVDSQVVPEHMPLLSAVEFALSQRHQNETSRLLARQSKRKIHAMRDVLRELMQLKAAAKAAVMLADQHQDHEQRLGNLDVEYDARIRRAEGATIEAHETQAATQVQRLKSQQLLELQFLVQYFASTVERHGQQQQQQQATNSEGASQSQSPPQLVVLSAGDDADDRMNDLRARLQLDADARIQQLLIDKQRELDRLETELDMQLRRLVEDHERFVEQERNAMETAFLGRVRGLAGGSKQRVVLEKEKNEQLTSLLLMLSGRHKQHAVRAKRLATLTRATVEHEYARKIQIVTATMSQRIVEEKELLWQKVKAVAMATTARGEEKTKEEKMEEEPPVIRQLELLPQRETTVEDGDSERNGETSDLRRVMELRLSKIEELLHEQLTTNAQMTNATTLAMDLDAYKQSLAQAMDDACQWRDVLLDGGASDDTRLRVVSRDAMDVAMQTQIAFANALVKMMLTDDPDDRRVDSVVVAASLPVTTQDAVVTLTHVDTATRTLFVRTECFTRLAVGQWALLLVHGVAEATTHTRDVADPRFVGCVYRLLVQCYQNLFVSQAKTAPTLASEDKKTPATVAVSTSKATDQPRPTPGQQWQSRLGEMERFLSGFHLPATRDAAPRLPHEPSSLRRSTLSLSGRLLLGTNGSDEMEALAVHERRQFVLEKLDAAEKLYAHVLRQHQEQKQSLEFVREMREQEKDKTERPGSSSDSSSEAKTEELRERLDALDHEAHALEHALDQTRRERDDLFAQCQALRDELQQHAMQAKK